MQKSRKTYGKYRKSTEGKNILCTNREIMHLCQVNEIGQYLSNNYDQSEIQRQIQINSYSGITLILASNLTDVLDLVSISLERADLFANVCEV